MQSVRESLEQMAGRMTAGNLPAVTAADNGKILMVVDGVWAAAALPTELPAVAAEDAGKVLTVDSNGDWAAVAPETTETTSPEAEPV